MDKKVTLRPLVTADKEGRKYNAEQTICACGAGAFFIIRIHDQDHYHFKCLYCETVYCGTMTGESCNKKGAIPIDN